MINLFCVRPKGFNVGNDAIFLGLQHLLYEAFGEVVNLISVPATSKYESQARAGLTAKTIYEINQYGHGVIVGGGNLYENGELDVSADALPSLEPPLMLFSLSRGRVYNRRHELVPRTDALPERLIRALDQRADFALFRDQATGEHLRSLGCRHHAVGSCPTILLEQMAYRLPELPASQRDVTFISLRHPQLMSIPLCLQSRVHQDVARMVDYLRKAGHDDVRLLCHDHRDLAFAASFSNVDYVYTGDVFTYLSMLRHCRLTVSYRLHSFLPCLAFGRPAIKISYDERALSLVDTLGLDSWNINMIHDGDVAGQLADRMQRLESLNALQQMAQPTWRHYTEQMQRTFGDFANAVKNYAHKSRDLAEGPKRLRVIAA